MLRPVDALLAALDSPSVADRLDAATQLRDRTPPPIEAIPKLVARIEDDGRVDEDWTDWTGGVVGGTTHHVTDRIIEALVRLGTPAFTAVLDAVEAGALTSASALHRIVASLPMDALVAAGEPAIRRAQHVTPAPAPERSNRDSLVGRVGLALARANDELTRAEDRLHVLGERLLFPVAETATLAARELGTVRPADATRAATLLAEALLHQPPPDILTQRAAATSLDDLGAVLDAAIVARLVAIAPTQVMFYCWPELLPAVARYGEAAASLGPWLLGWVRDEKSPVQIDVEHHANVRAAAATGLGRIGVAARPLHDELAEIYASGPAQRRQLVLRAVPDRSALVSRLGARWRAALAGTDRKAIEDALDAIAGTGASAAPLLDAIMPFVEGDRAHWQAISMLGKLGEVARPVVPALIRALQDLRYREWACISLRQLGRHIAADAIAPLEELAARDRAAGKQYSPATQTLEAFRRG